MEQETGLNEEQLMTLDNNSICWETMLGNISGYVTDQEFYTKYFDIAEHVIEVIVKNDGSVCRCTSEADELMNCPAGEDEKNLVLYALEFARIVSYCTWVDGDGYGQRGYILVRRPDDHWMREFLHGLNLVISLFKMVDLLDVYATKQGIEEVTEGAPLKLRWLFTEKRIDIDKLLTPYIAAKEKETVIPSAY